ncbi:hypothetical protein [Proteus mirabilis]|uniref:hypothetical protein n=1 Tax=Proteus mirabilis TaxID=584 RepID=UPI0034D5FF42
MSNYSSIDWNIKLSSDVPTAVIDTVNALYEHSFEANVDFSKLPNTEAALKWDEQQRALNVFANYGSHVDGELPERIPLSKDNLYINAKTSTNYTYGAMIEFINWLAPWVVNKDEVLAVFRNEDTGGFNELDFGDIIGYNEDGLAAVIPYKLSHCQFGDILNAMDSPEVTESYLKLSYVKNTKYEPPYNGFGC